jgi:small GTP-binding protein
MKIVISGSTHSGKSSLIKALDSKALCVEEKTATLVTTTVAMDVGKYQLDDYIFTLFGTPGFDRFSVIRQILMKGTDVLVFLFDGEGDAHDDNALNILKEVQATIDIKNPRFYLIFAVNKIDLPNHRTADQINDLIHSMLSEEELKAVKAVTYMKDADAIQIYEISAQERQNIEELMKATLVLAIKKWKPILEKINKSKKTIEDVMKTLNLQAPQLKDLLNELGMRKLLKKNTDESLELTPHGKDLIVDK